MTFLITEEKTHSPGRTSAHDHAWELESTHATSLGQVMYMKCIAGCGARRVDTISPTDGTHSILSKEINRGS